MVVRKFSLDWEQRLDETGTTKAAFICRKAGAPIQGNLQLACRFAFVLMLPCERNFSAQSLVRCNFAVRSRLGTESSSRR